MSITARVRAIFSSVLLASNPQLAYIWPLVRLMVRLSLATALEPGLEFAAPRYATATQPLRQAIKAEILKCTPMVTPWLRGIALRMRPTGEVTPRFGDAVLQRGR